LVMAETPPNERAIVSRISNQIQVRCDYLPQIS